MPAKSSLETILASFSQISTENSSAAQLSAFVAEYFDPAGRW
jgi:hypothetical protein